MDAYKNPALPTEKRVADLLSKMTLEEKVAQLCGDLPASVVTDGVLNTELLRKKYPHGHGRFTQYSMLGLISPQAIAQITNQLQEYFVKETRLGIPVALQSENLSGYPASQGTLFPSMINLASTWMPELAGEMSRVIGSECRAVGINSAMSPVIDIARDPRWGRMYETFGEDHYLTTLMGVEYIKGMQGDKENGVACVAKHFLGYSETQGGLNAAASRLNDRELYEVFATPFEAAANLADVSAMMASYSEIDGIPVGANPKIARTLLRDVMEFRGVLTSDGAGVMKMFTVNKIAGSYEEAGLLAINAGLETEIPIGGAFRSLPQYVNNGQLDMDVIDTAVARVLTVKFEYGLFENPYADEQKVSVRMVDAEKRKLSAEISEKSMVLLQNDGILPLAKQTKIALIGPHADNARYPIGSYSYPSFIEVISTGSQNGGEVSFQGMADEAAKAKNQAPKDKPAMGNPFAAYSNLLDNELTKEGGIARLLQDMGAVTLKEALEKEYPVTYVQGCGIMETDTSQFDAALAAAKNSDVVVMAAGGNSSWVNATGGEGKDRCSLALPGVQQELLETLVSSGKPVVLVLLGPGIFSVPWAVAHCSAIVQAWLPGLDAGRAIADVLSGAVNPGGKLPITVPRSVGQIPVTYNHKAGSGYASGGDENIKMIFAGGYVGEDDKPLYPFGHGLSYTQFEISGFTAAEAEVSTEGTIHLRCQVKNTGKMAGDEVVQLYYSFAGAHVTRPVKQLAGFARVALAPKETKTVEFDLQTAQLGYYNEHMEFVLEPGQLTLMIGNSAHSIAEQLSIAITGQKADLMGRRSYICETRVVS